MNKKTKRSRDTPVRTIKLKVGRPKKAAAAARQVRAREILETVCSEFGVTKNEIGGRTGSTNLRAARREFCRRCADAKINLPYIATLLKRDLSTIKHLLNSPTPSSYAPFVDQLTVGSDILRALCEEGGFDEDTIRSASQAGLLPLARREFTRRCKAKKISVAAIAHLLSRGSQSVYAYTSGNEGSVAIGTLPSILQDVCAKFGITAADLQTSTRSDILMSARREFCQRCFAERVTVADIARALHRTRVTIYKVLKDVQS